MLTMKRPPAVPTAVIMIDTAYEPIIKLGSRSINWYAAVENSFGHMLNPVRAISFSDVTEAMMISRNGNKQKSAKMLRKT